MEDGRILRDLEGNTYEWQSVTGPSVDREGRSFEVGYKFELARADDCVETLYESFFVAGLHEGICRTIRYYRPELNHLSDEKLLKIHKLQLRLENGSD